MYSHDGGSFSEGYAIGRDTANNGWGNGFGGDWLSLLVILALFGWGNGNGFGGFGGGNNMLGYELGRVATTNDVASGFNNSAVLGNLNSIKENQLQMQNFINQGFSGLSSQLIGEFRNVDNAICTLGYQNQAGFNTLAHQISDCCCTTQRAIDRISYENAKNTCDIIQAGHNDTDRILNYLTSEKISSLQSENAGLKAQISNDRQSAYIIGALSPKCPEPAYIVPNPNCCYNYGVVPTSAGCSGFGIQ